MKKQPAMTVTKQPVWDLYRDGVTQSLLGKFLICRHRFWVRTVLGLQPEWVFNHRIEYGNLFHAGMEALGHVVKPGVSQDDRYLIAREGVENYAASILEKYPDDRDVILFWTNLAAKQIVRYIRHHWKEDQGKTYIASEQVFDVPINLPSGRTVRFRGKMDEVYSAGTSGNVKRNRLVHVIQENKVKGDIDEEGIVSSLNNDLQTQCYFVAWNLANPDRKSRTLLYNVIQRPNGSWKPGMRLVQRKGRGNAKTGAETDEQFSQRIVQHIDDNLDEYFKRWVVEFSERELAMFYDRTFVPILEQLCDWWDSIKANPFDPWQKVTMSRDEDKEPSKRSYQPNSLHYCRPFGIYDSLSDGARGDYFDFLARGRREGLVQLKTPFPELDDPSLCNRK